LESNKDLPAAMIGYQYGIWYGHWPSCVTTNLCIHFWSSSKV